MQIQSKGDIQCSLETLRVPGLCVSQSSICFMNCIHDLDSVWRRQTVFTINIKYSGGLWYSFQQMFMKSLHDMDSVWWRKRVFTGNISYSVPRWFPVPNMIHELYTVSEFSLMMQTFFMVTLIFWAYMVLSPGYVSWIILTIWIQCEVDKQCSLVTLRLPDVYGTYSDINFMNNLLDLDSVWWKQRVVTGNIS
jgi:hypothetical protein